MKFRPADCKRGDMIRVRVGSIWHYGVYVSEDEVIQFGAPPREGAARSGAAIAVCTTSIDEFSGGSIVQRAQLTLLERMRRIPPDKTVALARSRIGECGYDLLHNNCEHFAHECVFGVKRSEQEEEARKRWSEYAKAHGTAAAGENKRSS